MASQHHIPLDGMAGLKGKCGAYATQQPCLKSTKWLQTWTLIQSVMRRPQSDSRVADCQVCQSTLSGSNRTQWRKTLKFKGNCSSFNETVFPLQVFVCDESICSCFSSFLWKVYFQKVIQDRELCLCSLFVQINVTTHVHSKRERDADTNIDVFTDMCIANIWNMKKVFHVLS